MSIPPVCVCTNINNKIFILSNLQIFKSIKENKYFKQNIISTFTYCLDSILNFEHQIDEPWALLEINYLSELLPSRILDKPKTIHFFKVGFNVNTFLPVLVWYGSMQQTLQFSGQEGSFRHNVSNPDGFSCLCLNFSLSTLLSLLSRNS